MNESALLAARRGARGGGGSAIWTRPSSAPSPACRAAPGASACASALVVAYHEAGHALCAELLPTQDPVRKVSILPRGAGALGYTMTAPTEDRFLMSRQEIVDRLVVLLGGRVAEEITVGEISTGRPGRPAQRHRPGPPHGPRARHERGDGPLQLRAAGPQHERAGRRWPTGGSHEYSDETARAVDAEVARLLGEAQGRARSLLGEHRAALERIARRLLEAEVMNGEELRALVGVRQIEASPG